ncbi:MAG: hypothetical protein CXR30_19350 [Geobacter sp.]|nr:MAG: hypothetical protein CXR30_19350 [Geobacter sp.]
MSEYLLPLVILGLVGGGIVFSAIRGWEKKEITNRWGQVYKGKAAEDQSTIMIVLGILILATMALIVFCNLQ